MLSDPITRRALFEELDRPNLNSLPAQPYCFAEWRVRRVGVDYHVELEGHFYSVVDESMLFCFDAKTGDTKWEQRLGGRFRSSVLLAGNMIYATNDKGLTTIFRATSDSFHQVAANHMDELTYATPAISEGRLYIRGEKQLYCIGTTGQARR